MLRNRRASTLAVAAILSVFAGQLLTAADDVVVIKRGTFSFEAGDGQLDVSGTQGFAFTAGVAISGGFFDAYDQCQFPECAPGTTVDLNAQWTGNDLPGEADCAVSPTTTSVVSTLTAGRGFSSREP